MIKKIFKAIARLPFTAAFWIAWSVAMITTAVAVLGILVYQNFQENASETKCRAQTVVDLDIAKANLEIDFADLAVALNEGLPRDSPERIAVAKALQVDKQLVREARDRRNNSIAICEKESK